MPFGTAAGGRTVGGWKECLKGSFKPLNRVVEKYIHNQNAGFIFPLCWIKCSIKKYQILEQKGTCLGHKYGCDSGDDYILEHRGQTIKKNKTRN